MVDGLQKILPRDNESGDVRVRGASVDHRTQDFLVPFAGSRQGQCEPVRLPTRR